MAAANRDRATYRGGGGESGRLSAARASWWAGIDSDRRAALLARFIAAGQRSNRRSRQTRIERIVAAWLAERAITFQQNVQAGRFNLDILIGTSVVVECYGDFWHCNPELYGAEWYNRSLHLTAAEKWAKDAARLDALRRRGFRTLVLWERQIRHRPHEAITALEAFLERIDEAD